MDNRSSLSRLPSLDGWRALSILMVIGFHMGFIAPASTKPFFNWMFDGFLGVRFFFIISGFLITWLMILEMDQTGQVSFKRFYMRRCLRILPVYCAFLLVLGGFQLLTGFKESGLTWFALLTFTRNYVEGTSSSGHLWSLSVEEQFYLIWPAVFLCVAKDAKQRIRKAACILAIPVILAPVFRVLGYMASRDHTHLLSPSMLGIGKSYKGIIGQIFSDVSFFDRCDSLAFGCFCAILLADKYETFGNWIKKHSISVCFIALGLILIPYIFGRSFIPAYIMIPFGNSFQAAGFSMLLMHSVIQPRWGAYQALSWRWVRQIGILSYSLYIWQQIFWTRPWAAQQIHNAAPEWWVWVWLIPTFVVAAVSYYGLERPLLKLRSRFRGA